MAAGGTIKTNLSRGGKRGGKRGGTRGGKRGGKRGGSATMRAGLKGGKRGGTRGGKGRPGGVRSGFFSPNINSLTWRQRRGGQANQGAKLTPLGHPLTH